MDSTAPYGGIDPNSQHQLWSRWIFRIDAPVEKRPPVDEVVANARRYVAKLFHSTIGRVRCDQQGGRYVLIVEIEGPPAHDPAYVARVIEDVRTRFVAQGFGPRARLTDTVVGILAGDTQDGQPPAQLIVMPRLAVPLAST